MTFRISRWSHRIFVSSHNASLVRCLYGIFSLEHRLAFWQPGEESVI